jgi:hypothetical protein
VRRNYPFSGPPTRTVPAVFRQLKREIFAEKKEKARLLPRLKGRVNDPQASSVGANPALPGEDLGLPEGPESHRRQPKSNEFGPSDTGSSLEHAKTPGPLYGAGFSPLPPQAKRNCAQVPVSIYAASTSEHAALSARQLSYADGATYAGVVAGRPVKE